MARVLLTTDGSRTAIDSCARAVQMLGPDHDYTLLVVVPPSPVVLAAGFSAMGIESVSAPPPDPEADAEAESARRQEADEALARTAEAIPGVTPSRLVATGNPGNEICRVAEDQGFDMIVVGSHGWGLVHRVLVGSVSHHVLHHATKPVLVIREPRE